MQKSMTAHVSVNGSFQNESLYTLILRREGGKEGWWLIRGDRKDIKQEEKEK